MDPVVVRHEVHHYHHGHRDLEWEAMSAFGQLIIFCVMLPYFVFVGLCVATKAVLFLVDEARRDIALRRHGVPTRELLRRHLKQLGW